MTDSFTSKKRPVSPSLDEHSSTAEVLPVIVTAQGTVSAVGSGVARLREALTTGRSGLAKAAQLPGGIGRLPFEATVGFCPEDLPPAPPLLPYPDTRQLRLAWATARQIEEQVAEAKKRWSRSRIGLVLGTSTGGILSTEAALLDKKRLGNLPTDYSCQYGHNMDAAARYLAQKWGVTGPVFAVSAACASGAKALASARRLIDLGVCDAVVAGGVDSLCRMTLHGFHSLGVLSQDRCRPFDDEAYGMNVAEGATLLLLERASAPDEPFTIALLGVGESSDAYHMSAPDPSGASQATAMARALSDAHLAAGKVVGYINAHGTGTKANDLAERACITSVLGDTPASSTKGIGGHQLGAAGATEALIVIEALLGTQLSGSGSLEAAAFPLRLGEGKVAMSNSFAFGGANISLLFGRAESKRRVRSGSRDRRAGIVASAYFGAEHGEVTKEMGKELFAARSRARASEITRLGAHLIVRLGVSREELAEIPIIVGSAMGQIRTTLRLIDLFLEGDSSPLAFQSSVHNAVAGALSLALSNKKPSSSIAGGDDSSFCAFLEALTYLWTQPEEKVVVLCVDESPPPELGLRPYMTSGAAFLLQREPEGCAYGLRLTKKEELPSDCAPLPFHGNEQHQLSPESIGLARLLNGQDALPTHTALPSRHADWALLVEPQS